MSIARNRRALAAAATAAALAAASLIAISPAHADDPGLAGADLFVNPFSTTLEAAQSLTGQARDDAQLLGSIPSAQWFTKGTPAEVKAEAKLYVDRATEAGEMPVLVAYNLPFRDCAQYSAGGAKDTAAYEAWIDGLAAGIGGRPATVILEPDGLGIIPWYTTFEGTHEWCQLGDPATAASDRFTQLNYAVDALGASAATSVYLDGTHNGWLNVGDASDRLVKAGVARADGFFLNASNYQFTANLSAYGRWISSCIAYATQVAPGDFGSCGNQYWNGGPATDWVGTGMDKFGQWSAGNPNPALNTDGVDSRYTLQLGAVAPRTHFVLDTSRNGAGPWAAPAGKYSDAQDWCNPPGRGLGERPTTETGDPLIDAYLWIKVPGESDGECYRGTAGPNDPERGMKDPAAGAWFPEQAHELIGAAVPGLAALDCHVAWDSTGAGNAASARIRVSGASGPWSVSYVWSADQKITKATHAVVAQTGHRVTVAGSAGKPGNAPDAVLSVKGASEQPWIFWLGGKACTSD